MTSSRGTVLVADESVPRFDRQAGDVTMYEFMRILGQSGAKVVFKPRDGVAREPHAGQLEQMGIELQLDALDTWLPRRSATLRAALLARPDVAAELLPKFKPLRTVRLIYYVHDLHHLRERRRFEMSGDPQAKAESERLRRLETSIFRTVDAVLTPSDAEADIIHTLVPSTAVHVVPAYVCRGDGHLSTPLSVRRDLIFVGGFRHVPNIDAATFLVNEVMPRVWREAPDARLSIVGSDPPADVLRLASDRILVTGWVPDLGPYFSRAKVSVNPIRFGAGVKGKIVSSLEAGVPVVTTSVGAEGMALRNGVEALIADDADDIAEQVTRVLRDDVLAQGLSAAGRAFCETQFTEDRVRAALLPALGLA